MYKTHKISATFALAGLIPNLLFPQYSLSLPVLSQKVFELLPSDGLITLQGHALVQTSNPEIPAVNFCRWVTVTAYSSTPDQTDSTPFITASGSRVRDGIVACNFLRFGTRVRFPQIYGNKIFIVEDRMAAKNSHKIDIWFTTRSQAKQFGVRQLKVEVLM